MELVLKRSGIVEPSPSTENDPRYCLCSQQSHSFSDSDDSRQPGLLCQCHMVEISWMNHWCLYWCLWHISLHFVWKPYIRSALLWWYHISKVKWHWINGVVCLCIILWNCARHNSSILCVVVSQPSSLKRLYRLMKERKKRKKEKIR